MKALQRKTVRRFGVWLWPGIVAGCLVSASLSASETEVSVLLDRITKAYGGLERLESIESIEFEVAGYRISRHQSRRTEPPWDQVPVRTFVAVDYQRPLGVRDSLGNYPGGLIFPSRTIIDGDRVTDLDTERRTLHRGGGMTSLDGLKSLASQYLTPLLVRNLNRRSAELEYAGTANEDGNELIRVNFGSTGILVNPVTYHVYATISSRHDMAANRRIETRLVYGGYTRIDGISFPTTIHGLLPEFGDFTLDQQLVHLELNADVSRHLEIPPGFVEGANPHMGYGNEGGLRVRTLGEGVYLAGDDNTNVLYVEFDDYFVAMETGGMSWYVERVHEAMQSHMGDKPLRYVVPTHYHDDHAVGMRYYARIGATILTTPEKAAYIRTLIDAAADDESTVRANFEWLDGGSHVFSDETGHLVVLRYRDAPHTEDMLVGWLPRTGAIFSADIFIGWGGPGSERMGASPGLKHYLAWLDATLGDELDRVDQHVPVHGRPFSAEEIKAMSRRPRKFLALPGNRELDASNWYLDYGLFDETTGGRRDRVPRGSPVLVH
ncbi:MAG: MBL fold metallo-hydrolase [Xanthomonadales bacterium]|nr:MBL fold metallo-hydrolase [Xanthomonadales bacterium]